MFRLRFSYFAATFLIIGLLFLTMTKDALSQESISLGCCKTVRGTPACVGCGDGGLKCAIDSSLCVETNFFTLNEVCAESSIAGEAICEAAQTTGCCVTSLDNCADDVSLDSCKGQHWFEAAACSAIPQCAPAEQSSDHIDRNIVILAILIVIVAFILYRRRKPGT